MSDLDKSIVDWFNCLTDSHIETISDLSDGVLLYKIMSQLNPEIFMTDKIYLTPTESKKKQSNIVKFVDGMKRHFSVNMKIEFIVESTDIKKIYDKADRKCIYKLIQMVVAVVLKNPQDYISAMMKLDESSQECLMEFIQEIMGLPEISNDLNRIQKLYNKQLCENEELNELIFKHSQENEELQFKITELNQYIHQLEEEFNKKISKGDSSGASLSLLESQIYQKDYKITLLKESNENLKKDLTKITEQNRDLQEQIEDLKYEIEDFNKLKEEAENLKKKSEELGKFKVENKKLAITNANLTDRLKIYEKEAMSLNHDVQAFENLKRELEDYKISTETKNFKIEELNKQIKILCKEKQEAEEREKFHKTELKKFKDDIELRRQQTGVSHNELGSLEADVIGDYEDELEQNKKTMKKLLFSKGIITGLESQVDIVNKEKVKILVEKQTLEINKATLESEIHHLNEMLQERSKLNSQNEEKLKNKIEKLKKSNTDLHKEIQNLNETLQNNSKKIHELRNENQNLEVIKEELKGIYRDKQSLYDKLDKMSKENSDIVHQLNVRTQEYQKIQNKHLKVKEKLKKTQIELASSKETIDKFLSSSFESESLLKQQETYHNLEVSNLNSIIKERESEIEKLMNENQYFGFMSDKAKGDFESFNREKEELNQVIKRDEEKIKTLEKYKEDLTNSWKTEMNYVSAIVHEVGLEYLAIGRQLKRENKKYSLIN